MPVIKIRNWKGINTNLDENDLGFEYVKDSVNFRHDRGFISYESLNLTTDSIPSLASDFPAHNFVWETGIFCTLTSDPLAVNVSPTTFDVTVLIAKAWDNTVNKWHRVIYVRNDSTTSPWYELSKYGNYSGIPLINHINHTDFSQSVFSTNIDGKVFFRVDGGRLKIYFPHMAYWLGQLQRTWYGNYNSMYTSLDIKFYLNQLVDGVSVTNQQTSALFAISNITSGSISLGEVLADSTYKMNSSGMWFPLSGQEWERPTRITPALGFLDEGYGACYTYSMESTEDGTKISNPVAAGLDEHYFFALHTSYGMNYPYDLYIFEEYDDIIRLGHGTNQTRLSDHYSTEVQQFYVDGILTNKTCFKINVTGIIPIGENPFHRLCKLYNGSSLTDHKFTWLKEGGNVSEIGFDAGIDKYWFVITGVWDERDETILAHNWVNVNTENNWGIRVENLRPTREPNKRLTRLRMYIKLKDGVMDDYELVKDIDFLNPDSVDNSLFDIYPDALTGVTLNSNIGLLLDEDRIHLDYKLEEAFRSLVTIDDISFGATSYNQSYIYYSAVGGGNLMPDTIYSTNIYPLNNVSRITALANINNKIGIFTDKELFIIDVLDELGVLTFTIKSTLEFGVKNADDIAEIQGGVCIHTRHGIYTTTGYQSNLISEAIDNLVKQYYSTGNITYNKYTHELLYQPTTSENLYRFRFKDGVWEKIDKTYEYDGFLLTANDILIDRNGKVAYLTDDALHIYNTNTTNDFLTGYITSGNSDLGEPGIDKLLDRIEIDYKGQAAIRLEFDGVLSTQISLTSSTTRTTARLDYPLNKRKPFQKLLYQIINGSNITTIYGIEFHFKTLPRRRYN